MKTRKILFPVSILCLLTQNSHSQTIEAKLFQSFCNKMEKQNRDYGLVNSLEGTMLLEDPVTGKLTVFYGKEESEALKEFKRNDVSRQIEMLNTVELPIFPLKDTVYIIDTNFSFSDLTYKTNRIVFKIEREWAKSKNVSNIYFEKIWLRDDEFHLTIFNQDWRYKLDYSFKMLGNTFNATKLSHLDAKFLME